MKKWAPSIVSHSVASIVASLLLIFGFHFRSQPRVVITPSVAKMTPPQGAIPAAESFVADFDSTTALGNSLDKRDLRVFDSLIDESRKSPVQEYQLALDLLAGRNVRLYRQQQGVGPGFTYNVDCHCFIAPPVQEAAKPAAPKDAPAGTPAKK